MTPTAESDRIPRPVKGLGLVSLFNDFASEMVYPLLPAFITRTLGGGAVMLGVLDGAADLTSALMKWVSGRLADRPGWRKPLILGGYLSAVLVRPLMAVSSAAWQVIGFRVLDRLGKGARTPPRDALIADLTPPAVQGRAFGFHRGADHLGAVLGALAAWWLLRSAVEVRDVLAWSLVPGLLAFVLLLATLRGVSPDLPHAEYGAAPVERPRLGKPVLVLAALTFCRIPEALLLLRLQDLGVPIPGIPLVWAGLHVVRSASSYPGGHIVDRTGPQRGVALGAVVFALVGLLLSFSLRPAYAVVVFLLLGLSAGLSESGERVMVARLSPRRTGRGFGTYHAAVGVAALPAGLVFGWVYQQVGAAAALTGSAAALLATAVVWSRLRLES